MKLSTLAKQLQKLDAKEAEAIIRDVTAKVEGQQKLKQLTQQRQKLVKALTALDIEIARLEGRSGKVNTNRYNRIGRVRDRSQPTIVERAISVLSDKANGMRITELAKAIRTAGHKTLSKPRTFVTAVYLAIKRDPRFRRLSKGVYALRANVVKTVSKDAGK